LQRKFALGTGVGEPAPEVAALLPRWYRDILWHPQRGLVSSRLFSDAERRQFRALFPTVLSALKQFSDAGVEIHSGTDAPAEAIVPGAGLWEELRLLQRAGLSAEQALSVSAVASARYLAGADAARLGVGSVADLVLYERDPSLDLANLSSLQAVVRDGRYYSREQLDEQLATYRQWFDSRGYRLVSEAIVGSGVWLLNQLQSLAGS
jgi:hypothetical protein